MRRLPFGLSGTNEKTETQREGERPSRCIFCADMLHGDKRAHLIIEEFVGTAGVSAQTISRLQPKSAGIIHRLGRTRFALRCGRHRGCRGRGLRGAGFFLRSTKQRQAYRLDRMLMDTAEEAHKSLLGTECERPRPDSPAS